VRALRAELDVVVCAVDRHGLTYPDEVVAVIGQDRLADYRRGARVLAEHRVDAVLIQFDDTGYGGPAGAHVLDLAHELRLLGIPYLVHLHTLRRPADPTWLRTVSALVQGAARVLLATHEARAWLMSRHMVDPDRLRVVRMGAPVASASSVPVRPQLADALAGPGRVVSTIGSIRPGKGLDDALTALATITATHPDVRYVIAGAGAGDGYADELRERSGRLGLDGAVYILDAYLSVGEIGAVLSRTDVYLAPSLPPGRTWSGTLTCALAAGRPIVAGDHPYAVELLSGVGVLLPSVSAPDLLAGAVASTLDDPARAECLRAASARASRQVEAGRAARRLAGLVREVVGPAAPVDVDRIGPDLLDAAPVWLSPAEEPGPSPVAASSLDARRAVVAASVLVAAPTLVSPGARAVAAEVALSCVHRFGSPEGHADESLAGQAIWATGRVAAGSGVPGQVREEARAVRDSWLDRLPRTALAAAYACLGLVADPRRSLSPMLAQAAACIDAAWLRAGRGAAWPWFTARLEGEGVRVPHALIAAGLRLRDPAMVRRGLTALDWYTLRVGLGPADGVLRLPSIAAGYAGVELATDAGALVEALVQAHAATASSHYGRLARRVWQWFLGANRHGEPVYDPQARWCRLGVRPQTPDRSAGGLLTVLDGPSAPATLAFAGASLALAAADLVAMPALPAAPTLTAAA
jgi:glycosyltransferase involved in cell wall biosynthesis